LIAGGGAWQAIRSCIPVAAGVVGLQTTEETDIAELENVKAHNSLWQAVGRIEVQSQDAAEQSQEAADNTAKIIEAMPKSWKNRIKNK
jgi:hypothetical protein